MGPDVRKPVFGVNSDKARFKPACSATKASWKTEIYLVAIGEMILSDERITKALISLRRLVCAFVGRNPLKIGFLESRPI